MPPNARRPNPRSPPGLSTRSKCLRSSALRTFLVEPVRRYAATLAGPGRDMPVGLLLVRQPRTTTNKPMGSVLVLAPDPDEADALVRGFARRGIHHEDVRMEALDCVSVPALDMRIAVGGNGKAQYGIQAQYLIDRCDGIELLVCAGAAGRLTDGLQIGDIVLGTATVEHDYKERFNPRPSPRYDASPGVLRGFIRLAESMTFPFKVHFGVIASGDEDIVDPTRAVELRETTNALCVAWEGSGGARAARLNDIEFIELRGITDGADGDAARFFHDNVNDVMFNVAELLMAWSITRQSAA